MAYSKPVSRSARRSIIESVVGEQFMEEMKPAPLKDFDEVLTQMLENSVPPKQMFDWISTIYAATRNEYGNLL